MKLTTKSRYGTRLLLDIALNSDEGPVRVKDIARRQDISPKYLEKLVHELKAAGFLRSKRGPTGGHRLSRPAAEITVGDIVRALEGEDTSRLLDCGRGEGRCERRAVCLCRTIWSRASAVMYDHLRSVTLADLAADARRCPRMELAATRPVPPAVPPAAPASPGGPGPGAAS
ncbi:MAG: RrF2 family transcriptional regulator [Desulfovibrionaceae bacterium]|jgi:Rrf2 family protein|nr:RrF2 family transcriptional regulator [Desulfovibrionaceae bacterium]